MRSTHGGAAAYRALPSALVRVAHHAGLALPPLPNMADGSLGARACWGDWLRQVWDVAQVADAIGHASPALCEQVNALLRQTAPPERTAHRTVLSVVRYLARLTGRPTPAGLLAGVAPATFADDAALRWGAEHHVAAHADGAWLGEIIQQLESRPDVLRRLSFVANSTLFVRGDRLIVPYQAHTTDLGTGAVEAELRYTRPVRTVLEAANAPVPFEDLTGRIQSALPGAELAKVEQLLMDLVERRALITNLHAPSTEMDALQHLLDALRAADDRATAPFSELLAIHTLLARHAGADADEARVLRATAASRMEGLVRTRKHPVAVDVRLDAAVQLPHSVAREAERAAVVLARLSANPFGSAAGREYHQRFYQRYGSEALVPLMEVVADSGIGWPAGYPRTEMLAADRENVRRDTRLLALAQTAALDGVEEVVLDESLLAELESAGAGQMRLPQHLEVCARLDADSQESLNRGDFRLNVLSVSRAAGVLTGRFLHLLDDADRLAAAKDLAGLPTGDEDSMAAQLSFPPLDPSSGHVARAEQVLPTVISLVEYRDATAPSVLTVRDLAVGCDSDRLYLAAPALRKRVEAWALHALNLRKHTPPLARLITELSRGQCTQVDEFDWGAARTLPFLPRLRHRRIVLSPAQWRVTAGELPRATASFAQWDAALATWRTRRRLPERVVLTDGDWRLPLHMKEATHRVLLREHLTSRQHAVLTEAAPAQKAGWCGGRAHEIVLPLAATKASWPKPPRPASARLLDRTHHQLPGVSPVLLAKVYGAAERQDLIVARHLPLLFAQWDGQAPPWWFLRYQEGREHYLSLHIGLPDAGAQAFAHAAQRVSRWAEDLRRHGLVRDLSYASAAPQSSRFGSGAMLAAAEAVLSADSAAVVAQLGQSVLPERRALVAAHFTAMACAFATGTDEGMQWLMDHVPASAPTGIPRPVFTQAVRLANPDADFLALRQAPGGGAVVAAWEPRNEAVSAYRAHLAGPKTGGVDADAALGALLHTHFLRAFGVRPQDKAECLYLARAGALAHTGRKGSAKEETAQ